VHRKRTGLGLRLGEIWIQLAAARPLEELTTSSHLRHVQRLVLMTSTMTSQRRHCSAAVAVLLLTIVCRTSKHSQFFERPFVKRFALCYRTFSVLSCPVCDVGILWPNGWMDQDETWHARGPRPRPYCVRWGPSSLQIDIAPNFRPMSVMTKRLDGLRCHLVWR